MVLFELEGRKAGEQDYEHYLSIGASRDYDSDSHSADEEFPEYAPFGKYETST